MLVSLVNPFNFFKYGLSAVFLFIDGVVYWVISKLFGLFDALAGAQIITQDAYQEIANKFYVVIGIVMLFYLAYALLKTLINPDDLNKNVGKIATNLIVSLILLGVVPTIFSYAFELQELIMGENIIDNLIFGSNNDTVGTMGDKSAMNLLHAFLNPEDNEIVGKSGMTWNQFMVNVVDENDDTSFIDVTDFSESIHNGDASYVPLISTLCGCFLAYVLISFCLDLGIRVVKLAFYQIIAPIPILMRIIPEKKSVFDNWVKGSLATYMEVFIRLFIMYIVVYLVSVVFNKNPDQNFISLRNANMGIIGDVIIILGLFAFAKQAPKLLSDVMGIDSGNIKLGIGGKLAAGGAFGIGAILGGGVTTAVRAVTHGYINQNGFKHTLGSAIGGFFSGGIRSGKAGFSAKNFNDMKNAATQGAINAVNKRDEREEKTKGYRATYGDNMKGIAEGYAREIGSNIKSWATGSGTGILNKVKWEEKFTDLFSDYQAIYENPKYNAMDAELQKMKALQASGTENYEGQPIVDAIENLEGKMLESRMDSIRKNKQAAAYAMYNIAQMAKGNPVLTKELGIKVEMADDLALRGGQIIDKSTGELIDENKLYSIIEGKALANVASYKEATSTQAAAYLDADGNEINLRNAAKLSEEIKGGMKHQKKIATEAAKADKISIAYKEAMKRQEANKK